MISYVRECGSWHTSDGDSAVPGSISCCSEKAWWSIISGQREDIPGRRALLEEKETEEDGSNDEGNTASSRKTE